MGDIRARIKLNEKQTEKLNFYLDIYNDEPKWKLIEAYAVDGMDIKDISVLEKELEANNRDYSTNTDSQRKKYQRWTEKFIKESSNIFIDYDKVDYLKVICQILECYPDRNLFFQKDYPNREWTAKSMIKAFNHRRKIRIKNYLFYLNNVNFTEEDYKDGIEEFIEQSKREFPKDEKNAYVYKMRIEYPHVHEPGKIFNENQRCMGNYDFLITNLKGRTWQEHYEHEYPKYRGKYRDYVNYRKSENYLSRKGILFDRTRYPFTYYLDSGKKKHLNSCIQNWEKIRDNIVKHTRKSVKQYDREIFTKNEKRLYIQLGKNLYLILENSIKNARFVKAWMAIEKHMIDSDDINL